MSGTPTEILYRDHRAERIQVYNCVDNHWNSDVLTRVPGDDGIFDIVQRWKLEYRRPGWQ